MVLGEEAVEHQAASGYCRQNRTDRMATTGHSRSDADEAHQDGNDCVTEAVGPAHRISRDERALSPQQHQGDQEQGPSGHGHQRGHGLLVAATEKSAKSTIDPLSAFVSQGLRWHGSLPFCAQAMRNRSRTSLRTARPCPGPGNGTRLPSWGSSAPSNSRRPMRTRAWKYARGRRFAVAAATAVLTYGAQW